jgi:ABC-type taurine transport system ATPase subunit
MNGSESRLTVKELVIHEPSLNCSGSGQRTFGGLTAGFIDVKDGQAVVEICKIEGNLELQSVTNRYSYGSLV